MFKLLSDALNNNLVTLLIMIVFGFTIVKGIVQYNVFSYVSKDIKFYIFLISLYFVYSSSEFISYELYYLIIKIFSLHAIDNGFLSSILKVSLYLVSFIVCILLFRLMYSVIFKNIILEFHKILCKLPSIFRSVFFALFKFPKAFINVLVLIFILNTFSMFLSTTNKINKFLNNSSMYMSISNKIIVPFKYDLNDIILSTFNPIIETFKNLNSENVRYLYNGITIEQAVLSNSKIEKFAINAINNIDNDYIKAEILYNEVIRMLEYDEEKSQNIMNEDFSNLSGAIASFETKKGICFDYASLYSVFCKSVGISSRIVVGQGFDGVNWINHAWNEVYISEFDQWIEVDPTFGEVGKYFHRDNFYEDHIKERVIWEFSD